MPVEQLLYILGWSTHDTYLGVRSGRKFLERTYSVEASNMPRQL